jgi:hypothetical protein
MTYFFLLCIKNWKDGSAGINLSIEKKVLFTPEGVIDDDGASERNGVDVVDVEPGI